MGSAVTRILDDLREKGGLKSADIANIVHVSPPTVSRWSHGKGTPPLRTQTIIADLRYVVDRLSDFYTPEETRLWLHAKHPLLAHERAIDLIHEGRTEEILAVIERLDAGAYLQAMPNGRKARDLKLLDLVDALDRTVFQGPVWRAVREGRAPLQGHPSAGRWDPGTFDVLYTALEPDGALAEIHFHLSRQPVFPSKLRYRLHQIAVRTRRTLRLADMRALAGLGVQEARYSEILYARTREIGDAAHFLGFDGVLAPNARWPCLNLTLFTDRFAPDDLESVGSKPVDIAAWGERRSRRRSSRGSRRSSTS